MATVTSVTAGRGRADGRPVAAIQICVYQFMNRQRRPASQDAQPPSAAELRERYRMRRLIAIGTAVLWSASLVSGPAVAAGADVEWKAGLAQTKVTPEQPVAMSGYASRTKP